MKRIIFLFPTRGEIPKSWIKAKSFSHHSSNSPVLQTIPHTTSCFFGLTGMGKQIENFVTNLNLDSQNDLVILAGCAGALDKNLVTGDLVICEKLLTNNLPDIISNKNLCQQILQYLNNALLKNSYTSTQVVSNIIEKDKLYQFGGNIVEMENYWVGQILNAQNIPWICLRIILDSYIDCIPDMGKTVLPNGEISILNAMLWLFTHPHKLPDLLHLMKLTKQITPIWQKTLEKLLSSLIMEQ